MKDSLDPSPEDAILQEMPGKLGSQNPQGFSNWFLIENVWGRLVD